MSDIQLSKRVAEVYDEFFVPALFAEWPARILAAAEVQAGQRVLDVLVPKSRPLPSTPWPGCSTGWHPRRERRSRTPP